MRSTFPRRPANTGRKPRPVRRLTRDEARMLVQRHPERAENWRCLGQVLLAQSPEEARDALEKARSLAPGDVDVLRLLAQAESTLGRHQEAVAMLEQAIAAAPGSGAIHVILANVFYERGDYENALAHAEQACQLTQEAPEAMLVKGNALHRLYRYDEALGVYDALSAKYPKDGKYLNNAGNVRADLGRQEEASNDYRKAIALMDGDTSAFSNYITTLHYLPASTREDIFRASTEWQALFGTRKRPARPGTPDKRPDRRLRIGMFSDGFRGHPVGWMITAALENLKPHDIELFAYSTNNAEDGLTSRIKAVAAQWMSVRHLSDPEFAQRIRSDKIDILFDLCGHFSGTRMPAVVEEPAPLIVKWVGGLINTSGVPAIDYLLTDAVESPSGEDAFYTEKLIRMPDDYICYTPPAYLPPVSALPARSNGHITLGCFNNPRKINELVLAQWARILHQLPDSRLFLKGQQYNSAHLRKKVTDCLETLGIDESRLIIEGPSNHQALLAAYNRIDIALDPWPYSGGLTTVEAMLMGVPVVTMPGPTFAGRHSATHLVNAGMPELVADDWRHYQRLVVGLANDLDNLATIRTHLRNVLLRSPVCDGARFAEHFSTAMRAIWQRYCQGKSPAALTLDKAGQARFEDDDRPIEITRPAASPESGKSFSFSLEGKITVLDHGAVLAREPRFEAMQRTGAYSTVIIDPAGILPASSPVRNQENTHYFPLQALGNGETVHLHACLDPSHSATLTPLSTDGRTTQILTSIPLQSQRIDNIDGLRGVDWLVLDDRHDNLSILEGGERALADMLAIQVRLSFQPTHKGQTGLTHLSQWLGPHGFVFHHLATPRFQSHFPENLALAKSQSSQLTSADALFLPDTARIENFSDAQRIKLAFILHSNYGIHDMAYRLLAMADETDARAYLREQGYLAEPAQTPDDSAAARTAANDTAELAERVAALPLPVEKRPHGLPGRLVVTLTSYGKRFATLHLTLKSLLAQSVRADRTVLWIAEDERAALPQAVLALQEAGLDICFCEDIRSYKKIIPTLKEEWNSFVVTADDDFYYEPEWLAGLALAWDKQAKTIVAHRAHRIRTRPDDSTPEPYRNWEWQITSPKETSDRLFPTSGSGVLYPPGAFDPSVTDQKAFLSLCPDADDIWLYWMCRKTGCRIKTSGRQAPYINWPGTQDDTLWHKNLLRDGNDRQIAAMQTAYGLPYAANGESPPMKRGAAHLAGDSDADCSFRYEGTPIHFHLPSPKDHIQRIIRTSKTFYEHDMLRDIQNRLPIGSTILDIGANIGNHTVFFAKICRAKRVYAFEPQRHVFETLVRNVKLNDADEHVRCLNVGLGRVATRASLGTIDEANLGMTRLNLTVPGEVEIVALDDLLQREGNPEVGLIKIDVEGMEMEVLAGATNTLAQWGPMLYAEAGTPEEFQRLSTYLAGFGYQAIQRFNATATYLFKR